MTERPIRKTGELDARSVTVSLSEGAISAVRALESAVDSSEHFFPEEFSTLQHLATNPELSVDDLLGTFHMLARPVFAHINATHDERAQKAWNELGSHLLEDGITLRSGRNRNR